MEFVSIIKESIGDSVAKDQQVKEKLNLNKYTKIKLTDALLRVYSTRVKSLSNVILNKDTKGYIWIDNDSDSPVAVMNIIEKDDGYKWIETFEVYAPFKGRGLSKPILEVAIRELKLTNLSVAVDNKIAISIFKSLGFKEYKSSEKTILMSRDRNAADDEDAFDESAIDDNIIRSGFYGKGHRWNGVVTIDGVKYRERVECLIILKNTIYLAKGNDIKQKFKIPGGSVSDVESNIDQVANECKEECRIILRDTVDTGITYIRPYVNLNPMVAEEDKWHGEYNHLFIAQFDDYYRGHIAYIDKDSSIASGKFYNIESIFSELRPEWQDALITYLNTKIELESFNKASEFAKKLILSEIFACKDFASKYNEVMCKMGDNRYAIIGWNVIGLTEDELDSFKKARMAIYSYCKHKFNNQYNNFTLEIDNDCFYINRKVV